MALSVHILKKLDDFTLNVKFETEREFMALLGASGSGKSMVLRCIAGLETPDKGRIVLNDRVLFDSEKHINLSPQKRRVGYFFERCALFPNMTVRHNLYAAVRSLPRAQQMAAVDQNMRAFRLEGLDDLYPSQLSITQRQRVALARLLANEPEALLLDEPFSALDNHLKWQPELELSEALRAYPGDALLVSSDRGEVNRLCDTVCVISEGHGDRKYSVPDLMSAPGSVSAALISGCKNFTRIKRVDPWHVRCLNWGVTLETAREVSTACTYAGVRAHSIHIAAAGEPNRFDAKVVRVIEDAFSTILMLAPDGGNSLLRMELSREEWASLRNPEILLLAVSPEHVMALTGELE